MSEAMTDLDMEPEQRVQEESDRLREELKRRNQLADALYYALTPEPGDFVGDHNVVEVVRNLMARIEKAEAENAKLRAEVERLHPYISRCVDCELREEVAWLRAENKVLARNADPCLAERAAHLEAALRKIAVPGYGLGKSDQEIALEALESTS